MLTSILVMALAQASASPDMIDPADGKPVICKKITETGSLVKSKKVCLSASRWSKAGDSQRGLARKMVADGTGTLNDLTN